MFELSMKIPVTHVCDLGSQFVFRLRGLVCWCLQLDLASAVLVTTMIRSVALVPLRCTDSDERNGSDG